MQSILKYSVRPLDHAAVSVEIEDFKRPRPQRVMFDGKMIPVEEAAQIWIEGGKDRGEVLRWLGFMLGFDRYEEVNQ